MKPLGKDMLSLLVAIVATVCLLWGSDALTQRLMHRSHVTYATAITRLLPINAEQVLTLIVLTLIVVTLCAVLSF